MVRLDKVRREKGCETLASVLREQILSGEVPSGELLPNERELGDQSGLSRGSVREAMRILETQGLITTTVGRNQGRRAVRPGTDLVRNSLDFFIRGQRIPFTSLMETFETLAPNISALAAEHRTQQDIDALVRERESFKVTLGARRFMEANIVWHCVVARASHNPLLSALYEGLCPSLLDPHVSGFTSKEIRTAALHAVGRIQEAIIDGDADAARRKMLSHVQAYRKMVEPIAPRTIKLKPAGEKS
ncbi:FadR/GntR family transcriptional regulator [Novosphingobium colocasiae]|uniref:FadR/GntR family transcriptional regulator n=1 Tax=Novosphingobium colocasiae TaxID=1256513 RepID=UPI0035AEE04A